jgi:hypothetical protein
MFLTPVVNQVLFWIPLRTVLPNNSFGTRIGCLPLQDMNLTPMTTHTAVIQNHSGFFSVASQGCYSSEELTGQQVKLGVQLGQTLRRAAAKGVGLHSALF